MGRERWARLGIFVIAAVTAVIDSATIASSPVHPYYGAAVRSMSMSWKAFLYGGFDPAASISIDKVPGAAPQIGWLLPLAAIGAVAGIRWRRGTGRTDVLRAGFVMWGLWLISYLVLFSLGQFDHTYYVVVMAPAVAALAGGGMAMAWNAYRDNGAASLVLPVSVAWSAFLALSFPKFLPGIAAAVAIGGTLAVLLLTRPVRRIWAGASQVGPLVGILAVLAGPGSWAVATSLAGPKAYLGASARTALAPGTSAGSQPLSLYDCGAATRTLTATFPPRPETP